MFEERLQRIGELLAKAQQSADIAALRLGTGDIHAERHVLPVIEHVRALKNEAAELLEVLELAWDIRTQPKDES